MTSDAKTILETEWSYFFDVEELDGKREELTIAPNELERRRLAQRLGILSIDGLKADIVVQRGSGEVAYHVQGKIEADLQQACVVTLEPVHSRIEDEFEAWFADPEAAVSITKVRHEKLSEKGHGEQPILDEKDDPEALVEGKIDLGELVTQYLSLAMNPYPHAEGVEFEQGDEDKEAADSSSSNPFAALKDWKDKLDDKE